MINWAAFSPLIGGNPIGTELAFGSPPQYTMNVDGYWANDSLYFNYMNNTRSINVPHYIIGSDNDKIKTVDVVIATCICAGLSGLVTNMAAVDKRGPDAVQNNHMYDSARFILENVKPKVLMGENAPSLYTTKGKPVADKLLSIANEFGYTFSLYKTNTALHGIPQHRHRTFYFMWNTDTVPELEWYSLPRDNLTDYLSKIPKGLLHSAELINPKLPTEARYRYMKSVVADVRTEILKYGNTVQTWIDKTNRQDDFIEWCKTNGTAKDLERAQHTKQKYSIGKGIWNGSVHVFTEAFNAYIGRNAYDSIHPTEERSLTVREGMALMGIPDDFELIGGMKNHEKLPQSVPVCTAKSMGEQIVKFLNGELKMTSFKVLKQNNETQTIEDYHTGKILQQDNHVVKLDTQTLEEHFN